MGSLAVINIIIAGVAVALGFFLLAGQGRDKQRLLFALLNFTTAIWILANYFGSPEVYWLVVADYLSGVILGLLFWLFSHEMKRKSMNLMNRAGKMRSFSAIVPALAAVFVIIILIFSGLIVRNSGGELTNGPLYLLYPISIFVFVFWGIVDLLGARSKARTNSQKTRVKLVLAGLVVAFVSIAIPNLLLENILSVDSNFLMASYNLSYVGIFVFVVFSTYAIIRHGLFDIKFAAVRSAAYILAIAALSSIYYVLAYLVSTLIIGAQATDSVSVSPFNIGLALILAFLFQPVKRFFDRFTNTIFYRDGYKSVDFIASLSSILSSTVNLRGLLERAAGEIATTFKSEHVTLFAHYTNGSNHHVSSGTVGHPRIPLHDISLLDEYVHRSNKKIFLTDILLDEEETLRRMLVSHGITLVMPFTQDQKIIGYVFLGARRSGSYTKRDLNVLLTISNELVIAIQNALSLHEVKELNATLQQKIDVATKELRSSNAQLKHLDETKDEFIGMASHQLRTPLTSVKGYISMVLEGDAGNVSPSQQKLLIEAFNSSERMVRLIADFLNVSRLQTGKFTLEKRKFDICDLVKQEAENLEVIAKTREVKLKIDTPQKSLFVVADEAKIRQVIMNYIDNAIYYSKEKSVIVIRLKYQETGIAFTVVDTGIGVPEAEQPKLFHKFFRAENARKQRPDGTGVGLFMARRVIQAHGGTIIFSSRENKGSTFGFNLPVERGLA